MPTNTISDRVTRLHLPLIVACAGWIGVLGTVVVAARYEVTADLGSGLVFNWVLGSGMIGSGLLLAGAAVGAEYLNVRDVSKRERRKSIFFRTTGAIGILAILYGVAMIGGV